MRAISTGLLVLLLGSTSPRGPVLAVSMTDVTGGGTSSAHDAGGSPFASPAWGTHADSLRAEALLPASEIRLPLERFLGRYNTDRVLVRRISRAVLRESRRQQVPTSLIAAVLVTENTTLRPEARSSVGAQGLMQVMPMHAGAELCQSSDLVDVDSNICHGTLILARDLRRTSSSTAALLRYNGCVRGTNTPDCHRYPSRVLARASIVRRELLAGTTTLALAAR
jgi:soluble lytic murein transglycosylase-like protein